MANNSKGNAQLRMSYRCCSWCRWKVRPCGTAGTTAQCVASQRTQTLYCRPNEDKAREYFPMLEGADYSFRKFWLIYFCFGLASLLKLFSNIHLKAVHFTFTSPLLYSVSRNVISSSFRWIVVSEITCRSVTVNLTTIFPSTIE